MGDQQIAFVRGLLAFGLMLGTVLAVAALIDAYRRKKSSGPYKARKLTRRQIFWSIIIVMLLFLLGIPLRYSALDR